METGIQREGSKIKVVNREQNKVEYNVPLVIGCRYYDHCDIQTVPDFFCLIYSGMLSVKWLLDIQPCFLE